jgi:N-formylglutamate amidohydrolase
LRTIDSLAGGTPMLPSSSSSVSPIVRPAIIVQRIYSIRSAPSLREAADATGNRPAHRVKRAFGGQWSASHYGAPSAHYDALGVEVSNRYTPRDIEPGRIAQEARSLAIPPVDAPAIPTVRPYVPSVK